MMGRFQLSVFYLWLLVMGITACGKKQDAAVRRLQRPETARAPQPDHVRVTEPSADERFAVGSDLSVSLEISADTITPVDSIQLFLDDKRIGTLTKAPYTMDHQLEGGKLGSRTVRAVTWHAEGRRESDHVNLILLSDTPPRRLAYRIRNVYPHDIKAYTQGLAFDGGYLYEGTGQYRESSLRKTEITTGEVIRHLNLPGDIFGEGIAIAGDRIFQLTYRSQVGFVYDKESFKRLQKVYYQNKEGWGLTFDGTSLVMSDGSHRIYFMDPEYFTEIRRIEVYSDEGPVSRLNELEFIEGKIFANVYGQERIVVIDPLTGKLLAEMNMQGILPERDRHRRMDVFNGIAWDPQERLMYVTGKYWPKLFEIRISDPF